MTGSESLGQPRSPRIFHGWWLVLVAGLVMLLSYNSVPAFTGAWVFSLSEEFGWSRAKISGAWLIFILVGLLMGPVVGFLADRVMSIRRLVIVGLIVLAAGLFLFSQVQNLWMYYTAVVLMAAGSTMSGWILLMTVVCRWFVRRRTTAIGVAFMIAGLGPIIFVALVAVVVVALWGWRLSAIVMGAVSLVVAAVALASQPSGGRGAVAQRGNRIPPADRFFGVSRSADPSLLVHRLGRWNGRGADS